MLDATATSEPTLRRRGLAAAVHQLLEQHSAQTGADYSWLTDGEGRSVILSDLGRRFRPDEIPDVAARICELKLSTRQFLRSCERTPAERQEHFPARLLSRLMEVIRRYSQTHNASPNQISATLQLLIDDISRGDRTLPSGIRRPPKTSAVDLAGQLRGTFGFADTGRNILLDTRSNPKTAQHDRHCWANRKEEAVAWEMGRRPQTRVSRNDHAPTTLETS